MNENISKEENARCNGTFNTNVSETDIRERTLPSPEKSGVSTTGGGTWLQDSFFERR